MTYEQKYGRVPDGPMDLETPPEDWQFEDPLVTVGKDGAVKSRLESPVVVKARPPRMRPISEILGKEDDDMDFVKLDMDKQIKLVAEEYNQGAASSEIRRRLGIKGVGTYYDRLKKAKERGLIAERDEGRGRIVTSEDLKRLFVEKQKLADIATREAERCQLASQIAVAMEELLGDKAADLVAALYEAVSA